MRSVALVPLAAGALAVLAGCADATGTVRGGEALTSEASACGTTWTSLYADFFGPTGQASCSLSSQSSCHGTASDTGAQVSGFVCGSTQDQCWQGMTMGLAADAGGGLFSPILPPDGGDPSHSQLWASIHKSTSTGGLENMPCGDPTVCLSASATYTFTDSDLACISTWAQQGAPNN
jgi:hypothetical protein